MKKVIKIIVLSLAIFIVIKVGYGIRGIMIEWNLKSNAVYYAKHMPHGEDKEPVLIMLIENLDFIYRPEIDGIKYDMDGQKSIILLKDGKESFFSNGQVNSVYVYDNFEKISYFYDYNFNLLNIVDNNYKSIDINEVDNISLKQEIYELVQPIIDAQPEPIWNLQEEFNRRYQDKFK